ncbi:MAG TPA: hypothetical protein VHG90_05210 [Acidimicrobiales bacterium]|nr:hypothetical protein [Acidimicrobiales bacterium]
MSNLAYLGIAVVISLIGFLVLWLRHRRPRSMEHSMRAFTRELDALAPSDNAAPKRTTRARDDGRSRRPG